MIYNPEYNTLGITLSEEEIRKTNLIYESCIESFDEVNNYKNLSLFGEAYTILAEMRYNESIVNGIMFEQFYLTEADSLVSKFMSSIENIFKVLIGFFSKAKDKILEYWNDFCRKVNVKKNRLYLNTIGESIKSNANKFSKDELDKFTYKVKVYRTDNATINIQGAYDLLERETSNYIYRVEDSKISEEMILKMKDDFLYIKDKIKEKFTATLFIDGVMNQSDHGYQNSGLGKHPRPELSRGGRTSFADVIPNDIYGYNKTMGKINIDNNAEYDNKKNISSDTSAFSKSYFITGEDTIYTGSSIISNYKEIYDYASGYNIDTLKKRFVTIDKEIKKKIEALKDMEKKIKKGAKDSNNDRILSIKYELLVSILNIWTVCQIQTQTLILNHSVAVAEKMNEYIGLLKEFKSWLDKQ